MKIVYYILLILLLLNINLFGQDSKKIINDAKQLEGIEQYIDNIEQSNLYDSAYLDTLLFVYKNYQKSFSEEKSSDLLNKIIFIGDSLFTKNNIHSTEALHQLAIRYMILENLPKAMALNEDALARRKKIDGIDTWEIARSYINIGLCYKKRNEFSKFLNYSLKAINIVESPDFIYNSNASIPYYNIAEYNYLNKNSSANIKNFSQLQQLQVRHSDTAELIKSTSSLARVYSNLQNIDSSYHINSLAIELAKKYYNLEIKSYSNLYETRGNILWSLKKYEEAIESFEVHQPFNNFNYVHNEYVLILLNDSAYNNIPQKHINNITKYITEKYGKLSSELADHYDYVANLFGNKSLDKKALHYTIKAQRLYLQLGKTKDYLRASSNVALCQMRLENFDDALIQFKDLYLLYKKMNLDTTSSFIVLSSNLGLCYENLNLMDSSIIYRTKVMKGMNLKERQEYSISIFKKNSEDVQTYLQQQGRYTELLYIQKLKKEKLENANRYNDIIYSYLDLAKTYTFYIPNHDSAQHYIGLAESQIKEINGPKRMLNAALLINKGHLVRALTKKGDAMNNYLKAIDLMESIGKTNNIYYDAALTNAANFSRNEPNEIRNKRYIKLIEHRKKVYGEKSPQHFDAQKLQLEFITREMFPEKKEELFEKLLLDIKNHSEGSNEYITTLYSYINTMDNLNPKKPGLIEEYLILTTKISPIQQEKLFLREDLADSYYQKGYIDKGDSVWNKIYSDIPIENRGLLNRSKCRQARDFIALGINCQKSIDILNDTNYRIKGDIWESFNQMSLIDGYICINNYEKAKRLINQKILSIEDSLKLAIYYGHVSDRYNDMSDKYNSLNYGMKGYNLIVALQPKDLESQSSIIRKLSALYTNLGNELKSIELIDDFFH